MRRRAVVTAVVVALAVSVALGLYTRVRLFAFAEEIMLYAVPGSPVLAAEQPAEGPLAFETSCADRAAPTWLLTPDRRPNLSLCASGRRFPLVVASYIGGYLYWPVAAFARWHRDDVLRLRFVSLLLGLVDILLTFAVVRRLRGGRFAAVAAAALAVTPGFVITHTGLLHFETLPWTFGMAALAVRLGHGARDPERASGVSLGRWVAAAFLGGLAFAANLKALVLFVPVYLVARRLGAAVVPRGPRAVIASLFAFAVPLVPSVLFALAEPRLFLGGDKSGDMGNALRENAAHPERILRTLGDMIHFWADAGGYVDLGGNAPATYVPNALAAVSFLFVAVDGTRTLLRRRGCPVTASVLAVVLAHVLLLTFFVRSYPVNFTPLHAAFGLCVASMVWRLWLVLGRVGFPRRSDAGLAALAFVALAPFAVSSFRGAQTVAAVPVPFNLHAEQSLLAHVAAHPVHGGPFDLVSTEGLLLGVLPSLSTGTLRVAEASGYLGACHRRMDRDASGPARVAALADCLAPRYRRLIEQLGRTHPVRFVLAADIAVLRNRARGGVVTATRTALTSAARDLGRTAVLEGTFRTTRGTPALELYRVDP